MLIYILNLLNFLFSIFNCSISVLSNLPLLANAKYQNERVTICILKEFLLAIYERTKKETENVTRDKSKQYSFEEQSDILNKAQDCMILIHT